MWSSNIYKIIPAHWAVWLAATALLCGAWFIEYILKVPPCGLCLWQRWPYYLIIGVVPVMYLLKINVRWQILIMFLLCLSSVAFGVFHTGVEQHIWEGLSSCGGGKVDYDPNDLLAAMENITLPRCDGVYFSIFGLSLANWNVIFSALGCWGLMKALFSHIKLHRPLR